MWHCFRAYRYGIASFLAYFSNFSKRFRNSCSENYVGRTSRPFLARIHEHQQESRAKEKEKHLKYNTVTGIYRHIQKCPKYKEKKEIISPSDNSKENFNFFKSHLKGVVLVPPTQFFGNQGNFYENSRYTKPRASKIKQIWILKKINWSLLRPFEAKNNKKRGHDFWRTNLWKLYFKFLYC